MNSQTPSVKSDNNFQHNTPVPKQVFNSSFKFSNGSPEKPNGGYLNGSPLNSTASIKSNLISATSFRQNLSPANKSFNQQHVSSPKKPAALVPYDSDDEKHLDDNSLSGNSSADKKLLSQKRDQKSLSLDSRPSSSNSNTSAGSGDSTLPSTSRPSSSASSSTHTQVKSEPVKEPIPILKVKATTNSWQVVEAKTPSSKVKSEEKSHKGQQSILELKSWKISRSSHFSNSPSSEKCSTQNGSPHEKYGESSKQSNKCHKEHSDSEKLERAHKEKKDKKKKHKKDKERQKRRDDDSDDDTELSWVERTKETLELESKSQHKSNGLFFFLINCAFYLIQLFLYRPPP